MTDISDKVLGKIAEENIAPRPRWHFIAQNVILWSSGMIFLVIGALAVSMMIFVFQNGAWEIRHALGYGWFGHAMKIFPLLWFVTFVLFILIARWAVSHTKKGYKYPLRFVVPIIIFASILLGFSIHLFGVSKPVDDGFGRRLPGYATLDARRDHLINRPTVGRIAGVVKSPEGTQFTLFDQKRDITWTVDADDVPDASQVHIVEGQFVLVVGDKIGEQEFHADDIHFMEEVKDGFLRGKKNPGGPLKEPKKP